MSLLLVGCGHSARAHAARAAWFGHRGRRKRRPAAARDLGGFLGYMRPFGSPSGRGGPPSPSMTRSAATPAMQRASRALPEPAGDVVVRARVAGAREDRVRVVVLD